MRCTARNQQALRAGQSAARSCELFAGLFVLTLHGSVVLMFSSRFAQTSIVHTPDCLLSDRDGLGLRHNSIGASQNSSHAAERFIDSMGVNATRTRILPRGTMRSSMKDWWNWGCAHWRRDQQSLPCKT